MKKILKKIFSSRSSISNWILVFVMYVGLVMFATILDMAKTIRTEQYLRICPEPYVCVVPDPEWKARPFMGLTIYKRVEV
tara:strand:+ start:458 stop:697 length:240 start_codon:yes stop_codon:yes gene_type:complete